MVFTVRVLGAVSLSNSRVDSPLVLFKCSRLTLGVISNRTIQICGYRFIFFQVRVFFRNDEVFVKFLIIIFF